MADAEHHGDDVRADRLANGASAEVVADRRDDLILVIDDHAQQQLEVLSALLVAGRAIAQERGALTLERGTQLLVDDGWLGLAAKGLHGWIGWWHVGGPGSPVSIPTTQRPQARDRDQLEHTAGRERADPAEPGQ